MTNKATFDNLMMRYSHCGTKKVEATGALLIGHAPHIAPEAWLNSVYPCLSEQETAKLERQLGTTIPPEYRHFLQNISNGVNVLVTSFCLYGKRQNRIRTSTDVARQPFDICDLVHEKPRNADENIFLIGGYDWDGSKLYIDKRDNRVYFCRQDDCTPLKSWVSLEAMLSDEIPRLYSLSDENGAQLDENQSTLPI